MAKFYGKVGYGESVESPSGSGIWVDQITEIDSYGDVIRNNTQMKAEDAVIGDISVGNSISILADEYAIKHFFKVRYVRWEGVPWSVTSVEVRAPRLILSLGSVYNGPTA